MLTGVAGQKWSGVTGGERAISSWWCGRALGVQVPVGAEDLQSVHVLVMKLAQGTTSV